MARALYFIQFFIISLLFLIMLAFATAFFVLKDGLVIQKYQIGGVFVEQLYLKLNNKLHLEAQNITIASSNGDGVVDTFYLIEAIEHFPLFFESVKIDTLEILQDDYDIAMQITYENDLFHIDSKEFYLYSQLNMTNNTTVTANPLIYLKRFDAYLFASMQYDLFSQKTQATARFIWKDAKGEIFFTRDGRVSEIYLQSDAFQNLKDIFTTFNLHPKINTWTHDNITAKAYTLEYFAFTHHHDRAFNPYNFKAKAVAKDVEVAFNPDLPKVSIDAVSLYFHEGRLLFDLKNPLYEGENLDNSFVYISDLFNRKPDFIDIAINTHARYDKTIKQLLRQYKIDILTSQKGGKVDARVHLKIPFKNPKVQVTGSVIAKNSLFELFGYKLPTTFAQVRFDNSFVHFDKVEIEDAAQKFTASGQIDLRNKLVDLYFDAQRYEKFNLSLHDEKFQTKIDYSDNYVRVNIPRFDTTVAIKNGMILKTQNLQDKLHYLEFDTETLRKIVAQADLKIESRDFINYEIQAPLKTSQNILVREGNALQNVTVDAHYNHKNADTTVAIGDMVAYEHHNKRLRLHNVDLNISQFINTDQTDKKPTHNLELTIDAKNSDIIIGDKRIISDNYYASIDTNKVSLRATKDTSSIDFDKDKEKIELRGKALDDSILHPLFGFRGFTNGSYDFFISGQPQSLQGVLNVKGGTLTNLKSYNNLIALINTIPSLAVFKSPGFNNDGLTIQNATIEFFYFQDVLYLNHIFIDGKSADIEGMGMVDMKNKTIDMDLKVKTFTEMGKQFSKIPLAGFILFGEDESLSFGAKISGSMDDPKVTTQTASKIITTPLNLIKRTIQSPFKLIQDIFGGNE
ncbi:MAG: AsmA-like C-terminal domain-containing protein [Campylobacterota bacterium]